MLFCIPNTNVFVGKVKTGDAVDIDPAAPVILDGILVSNIGLPAPV